MVTIRRLRQGEAALFRQVRLAALRDSPAAFGSTIESALARSPESWREQADSTAHGRDRATFIAFAADAPIGITALYRDADDPDRGELLQVWVDPAHRGRGVAVRLMEAALAWAAENDFQTILAEVMPGNERVVRFYRRQGFEPIDRGAAFAGGGVVLAKALTPQRDQTPAARGGANNGE